MNRKTIHLDTLKGLPGMYLDLMRQHIELLRSSTFLDRLIYEDTSLASTVEAINAYCLKNHIKCYHYTRAHAADIETLGLLCRSGDEIREAFLERHSGHFTDGELSTLQKCWSEYFRGHQKTGRDHRIFFNTTTVALTDGGAQPLFDAYGGEQIHMPLNGKDHIIRKLGSIGSPLIVVFRAHGSNMTGIGQEFPWGMTALSTYHRMHNPEAYTHDVDGYLTEAVAPENILKIHEL